MRAIARRAGAHVSQVSAWIRQYRTEGAEAFTDSEKKRKYDPELKAKAVEDYLSGRGSLEAICEIYHIRSAAQLLEWTRVYNRHKQSEEETGGILMSETRKATPEDRLQIVQEYLAGGKSYEDIAQEHGFSYRQVYDWVKKYKAQGVAGLEDRRGQRTEQQTPRTPEEELRVEVARLKHENYMLKMERDLLKKLKELERGDR